jgi:hypothetical protein
MRRFVQCLLELAVGLALMAASGQAAMAAQPGNNGREDPELQLQVIKAAILAAVEDAPVRVLSTAWVDAKGTLRENTIYNTDTQIRGVRVLSYLRGETETGEQKIQRLAADVVLPPQLRKPAKDGSCPGANMVRWRMPVVIEHVVQAETGSLGPAVGFWLSRQIDQLAGDLTAQSVRWYAVSSVASLEPHMQGRYWQTFLGRPKEDPGWRLRVRILPAPVNEDVVSTVAGAVPDWVRAWMPTGKPPGWLLQMGLQQEGRDPVWQWQTQLEDAHPESSHAASMVLQSLRERLPQALALLDRVTECVAVQYALRPLQKENGMVWTLAAGEGSRLRAGDRVLVFDRQSLPSRVHETESMRRVAMAEVTRAGPRYTELRQLAGPPLPLNGDWVAMPM